MLVAASALLVALLVPSASAGRTGLVGTGAFWTGAGPAGSLSGTVYVSAVGCKHVRPGQVAGQRSGMELFGTYSHGGTLVRPFDFAGFYSYCSGHRRSYRAEFLISEPGAGLLQFRPAGFAVAPGDPLRITITVVGARLRLTMTDVNTHRSRSTVGPSLGLRTGWAAGMLPIYAGANGEPILRGALPLVDEYSPTGGPNADAGPAPFAPVVFRAFSVGGARLNFRPAASSSSAWHGNTGSHASVTHPADGAFVVIGTLRPPRLGKTVDVTLVSGTSAIRTPGARRFHNLKQAREIPNGSEIDVSHGQVQLTLGLPHGKSETGVFYDGQFKLHQNRRTGATTATLTGGNPLAACSAGAAGSGSAVVVAPSAHAAAAGAERGQAARRGKKRKKPGHTSNKPRGKRLRSLWANAHGSFTTQGSGAAAAVLGTRWFTEVTCAGTYFKVARDKIRVTVDYPHPHTVLVTQGHSFFAPNPAPIISVTPVASTGGRYNVQISGYYELTVVGDLQPYYVDAAVAPLLPSGGNNALYPDGEVNGTTRWHIIFHITPNLSHFQDWNVGVSDGGLLYLVKLRVN